LGCRIFDDYREMLLQLAGTVEFCMIPTGIPLHHAMAVAALEARMHVLVERRRGYANLKRLMNKATLSAVAWCNTNLAELSGILLSIVQIGQNWCRDTGKREKIVFNNAPQPSEDYGVLQMREKALQAAHGATYLRAKRSLSPTKQPTKE
jgi:hypothetical protein